MKCNPLRLASVVDPLGDGPLMHTFACRHLAPHGPWSCVKVAMNDEQRRGRAPTAQPTPAAEIAVISTLQPHRVLRRLPVARPAGRGFAAFHRLRQRPGRQRPGPLALPPRQRDGHRPPHVASASTRWCWARTASSARSSRPTSWPSCRDRRPRAPPHVPIRPRHRQRVHGDGHRARAARV